MPKEEPVSALLKRVQKIERAHARLSDIAIRVRAQADTLSDIAARAQVAGADGARTPRRRPAARARTSAPSA